jgi:hypothetical protein
MDLLQIVHSFNSLFYRSLTIFLYSLEFVALRAPFQFPVPADLRLFVND